jgi:hypothetical protein
LAAGDVVRTAEDEATLAEVVHGNGAVTRLDRATQLMVDRSDDDGHSRVVVTLGPGRTWHHSGPLEDPTLYEARCPSAAVTARYAVFGVTCRDDGSVDIVVAHGNVVVRGDTAGIVALADGEHIVVSASGRVAGTPEAFVDADGWVAMNLVLDQTPPAPAPVETVPVESPVEPVPEPEPEPEPETVPEPEAVETVPVEAVPEPETVRTVTLLEPEPVILTFEYQPSDTIDIPPPFPRWAARLAAAGAAAAFLALIGITFVTADNNRRAGPQDVAAGGDGSPERPTPLPAGGASMIRAAQDRQVAPEPTTTTVTTVVAGAAPPALKVEAPRATASGTTCQQQGKTVVYSGTLANVTNTESKFVLEAVFLTSTRERFGGGTTTVGPIKGHGRATWQVKVAAPRDLRNTGASCEVASVRPA